MSHTTEENTILDEQPRSHANGNEFTAEEKRECQGIFVSHSWKSKKRSPELLSRSVMASRARRIRGQFQKNILDLYTDASDKIYSLEDVDI
ncbi:hypothetical protein FSHL1_000089 [Fusarium sambucinum]